jgi:DNA-binding Lrp family transcriptional regulator
MMSEPDPLSVLRSDPESLALRCTVALLLEGTRRACQALDDLDPIDCFVVLTIWNANTRAMHANLNELHAMSFELSAVPPERKVPISRNAVARFLATPTETVRRRCDTLLERGILVEREAGLVCVDLGRAFRQGHDRLARVCADAVAGMYDTLEHEGIELPGAVWRLPAPVQGVSKVRQMWIRAVARLALDYLLLVFSEMLNEWRLGILSTLILLSVAESPGKTIRDAANDLRRSAETIRRRVADLRAQGLLIDGHAGLHVASMVATRFFNPMLQRRCERYTQRLFVLLDQLAEHMAIEPRGLQSFKDK